MIAFGLRDERELRVVRRPRARRRDERDGVEMRVARGARELLDHSARLCIGHEELDLEQSSAGEERDELAVRAHLRREVHLAALAIDLEDGVAGLVRTCAPLEHRQVRASRRGNPVLRERIRRDAKDPPNAVLEPDTQRRAIHVHDRTITPAPADIRPQGLAVPVREEPRVRVELVDGRELLPFRRVAQPHGRQRIVAAEREILGHAFNEPERKRVEALEATRSRFRYTVLKHVHQFVAKDVVVVRVDAGKRHHHTRPQTFGHATSAFRQFLTDDVRLLEVRLVGVEHDGLAVERVAEAVRMARIPALGHAPRIVHDERLGGIEIQVEVRRPHDAEVELLVLDLVAAEVLCSPATGESNEERTQQREQRQRAGSETGHLSVPRSNRN